MSLLKKVFAVLIFSFFASVIFAQNSSESEQKNSADNDSVPATASEGTTADENNADTAEQSIIRIENAKKSEYKKDPVSGEDCLVLTGNVRVSVEKGKSSTVIQAEHINFNRATNMIYAEGDVRLQQKDGSAEGGDTTTANSLLFNTQTLEGVFDNGRVVQTSSDALNLPSGSTLIVASNVFGRDRTGTIAFKKGVLTFCDDEDPHWKIWASRIWLLPGGEFAFLNAFLFVGNLPVFYLPVFYYPKDELIFNPAFGYKAREGYFINTTTYLYGRKQPLTSSEDDDSNKLDFYSFMNTGKLKEQRREGLVLHNLDQDYEGDTEHYAKIMADYYSSLGTMVGFDANLKPSDSIPSFLANIELGFSNTVFKKNGEYSIYADSGATYQDSSHFLAFKAPFRYQANLKFSVVSPLTLDVSIPVYSDPFFYEDFSERVETMDWIDMFINGTADEEDEEETKDDKEISSLTWTVSGSYNFKLPAFFDPLIEDISITQFESSIVYSSKVNDAISSTDSLSTYSPERKFYYPSQITPFKISANISGSLIKVPSERKSKEYEKPDYELSAPDELFVEETPANETDSEKDDDEEDESEDITFGENALPLISLPEPSVRKLNPFSYTLGYSVKPNFNSQFSYSSTSINNPDDFDWNKMLSTYVEFQSPVQVTSKVGFKDEFITLSDSFTFEPVFQRHPYLNMDTDTGGYTESSANSIKEADYSSQKLDLTNTNALSLKPFYYTDHFSETALTWNTTVRMIRTKYISEDVENPEWEYLTTDVSDKDCVTVHNLNLLLAAKEGDFSQSLSLTSTLPPQVDEYSGIFTLGFPHVTFSAGTGIRQTSDTDPTWIKEDFSQTLAISMLNKKLKFSQSFVYKLEEDYADSLKFSLTGFGAQLAYTLSYVNGYDFDSTVGWKEKDEKEFQPYSLSLAYVSGKKKFKYLSDKVAIAPSLSTSVVYDFIKPTDSYFRFIPALTFRINKFLNLTFSSESRNSVIYRYFGTNVEKYYGSNVERNPVNDLINSFRFDDDSIRQKSGFKLKSLNLKITHDLHDWDFNCEFSIKPRLITPTTGSKYYDFSPYLSLSVVWRPMRSMKTEIVDDYGTWKLNP